MAGMTHNSPAGSALEQQQQEPLQLLETNSCHNQNPPGLVSMSSSRPLELSRSDCEEDVNSMSLFKFQQEKKSLCRNLFDEEVIFEKDDNDGTENDMKKGGEMVEEARSCSSTTPTANSWTVVEGEENDHEASREGEYKDQNNNNHEEEDVEEDRKPAAVDRSQLHARTTNNTMNWSSNQGKNEVELLQVPAAAAFDSSPASLQSAQSQSSSSPPPLISPVQQKILSTFKASRRKPSSRGLRKKSSVDTPTTLLSTSKTESHQLSEKPVIQEPQQQVSSTPAEVKTVDSQEESRVLENINEMQKLDDTRDSSGNASSPPTNKLKATKELDSNGSINRATSIEMPLHEGKDQQHTQQSVSSVPAQMTIGNNSHTANIISDSFDNRRDLGAAKEPVESPSLSPRNKLNAASVAVGGGTLKQPPPTIPSSSAVSKTTTMYPAESHVIQKKPPVLVISIEEPGLMPDGQLKPPPVAAAPAGVAANHHHHHPPLLRQRGKLNISNSQNPPHTAVAATTPKAAAGPTGGGMMMRAPMGRRKMLPIMNHNRKPQFLRPPFTASEETLQRAEAANRMQQQQRQQHTEKEKLQMQQQLLQLQFQQLQEQQEELERQKKQLEQQQQQQKQQQQQQPEQKQPQQQQQQQQQQQSEQKQPQQQLQQQEKGEENVAQHSKEDSNGNSGDDLDISNDELGDYSIVESQSFALAAKILQRENQRPQRMVAEKPTTRTRMGSASPRRLSIMEKEMSSIAIADPTFVSEPTPSIASRKAPQQRPAAALAEKRRMFQRQRSKRVIQDTAAYSFRSGNPSTMDLAVKEAFANAQQRSAFHPRNFSIKNITLDNPVSTHSSIAYSSVSNRSLLDNSAHFFGGLQEESGHGKAAHSQIYKGGYQNYSPPLQPHKECDSTSSANRSSLPLDASSTISPPTRQEMEERRLRRASRRSSIYVKDDASQASSKISAGTPSITRRSTSGAGLRRKSKTESQASERGLGRRSSKPGEVKIPLPRQVDPTRFLRAAKKERDKEDSELWGDILECQNEMMIKVACEMSLRENETQVKEQQQPHIHRQSETMSPTPSMRSHAGSKAATSQLGIASSASQESQLALQHQLLLQQQVSKGSNSPLPTPSIQTEPMDPALQMAIEESRRACRPVPVKSDSDRALEVALEISRAEVAEIDRQRHADPFSYGQGSISSESKKEKLAPLAPLESNFSNGSDAEVAGTMEVAVRLSQQEYDHETSKRKQTDRIHDSLLSQQSNAAQNPSHGQTRISNHGSALDYSESTQSLVMPAEMLEDDESIHRQPTTAGTPAVDAVVEDEALALALALSKMDGASSAFSTHNSGSTPLGPTANHLSQEESLAYALELSRRAPGAHHGVSPARSTTRTPPTRSSMPTTSSGPPQSSLPYYSNLQPLYSGNQIVETNMNDIAFRQKPHVADEDEALKMALTLSYEAAYGTSRSASSRVLSEEEESLQLALALSRKEAYGDGY